MNIEPRDILKELYEGSITEEETQRFYDSVMEHPVEEITMPERFICLRDNREFHALVNCDIPLRTVAQWRYEGWPTHCAVCGRECDITNTRVCGLAHKIRINGEVKTDVAVHADCKPLPYAEYRELPAWAIIDKALDELETNRDLEITTVKDFVVGYLVKKLQLLN